MTCDNVVLVRKQDARKDNFGFLRSVGRIIRKLRKTLGILNSSTRLRIHVWTFFKRIYGVGLVRFNARLLK